MSFYSLIYLFILNSLYVPHLFLNHHLIYIQDPLIDSVSLVNKIDTFFFLLWNLNSSGSKSENNNINNKLIYYC